MKSVTPVSDLKLRYGAAVDLGLWHLERAFVFAGELGWDGSEMDISTIIAHLRSMQNQDRDKGPQMPLSLRK